MGNPGKTYSKKNFKPRLQLCMLLIALISLLVACEDPYIPELNGKYDQVLVVDGMITNNPPPYTIRLSLSSPVEASYFNPVHNFEVWVEDELGNKEVFTEADSGNYISSSDGMQGEVGMKYKLMLHSPAGKSYESEFEKLRAAVGIDSLYTELQYRPSDYYPYSIPGYQFYIDTHRAEDDSTYLLWQLDETYKFHSDYKIYSSYDGILHDIPNHDTLFTCWYLGSVYPFYTENTIDLNEPKFTKFPLNFVDTQTRQLSVRYSLYVSQYTIDSKAFHFWNAMLTQNAGSGELFSTQPFQLRGNISNPENPDEVILGYFMVAGVSQKRIYVNRPHPPIDMLYPICELTSSDYEAYGWMFLGGPLATWPLYITHGPGGGNALPEQSCIDCTKKGGNLQKPDFWVDE